MYMEDKNCHKNTKKILLYVVVFILSLIYVLIFSINPLGNDSRLTYTIGMGTFCVLLIIGELPFIKRKIKRVNYWLLMMIILIIIYFLI